MSGTLRSSDEAIARLGTSREIGRLRKRIAAWMQGIDGELGEPLDWAFSGAAKYFRPLTVFAAHRSTQRPRGLARVVERAFAIELTHNMSLIVDDVLDRSQERRGVATIQFKFGLLNALMASGYLVADAFDSLADDPFALRQLSALLRRLGSAECRQWRLRREPLGLDDWRSIAAEDTGSMFETCAVLGADGEDLRAYGRYLGMLYHGCDDVADQRGLAALGGGGEEDVRDGILTLPAALALRKADIRALFARDDDDPRRLASLAEAFTAQLDSAEAELDRLASAARAECAFAADPEPLLMLVDEVRQLSAR